MSTAPSPPNPPTIHEAELASGASGAVLWGAEIDLAMAILRRLAGENVVVRGLDLSANRAVAQQIEAAVGPYIRSIPHSRGAGPAALPHFQQLSPLVKGHCFYETGNLKARKRP